MPFGPLAVIIRIEITEPLAYAFQPETCPGEFDTENRKSHRDHYNPWPGRNEHDDTNGENRRADEAATAMRRAIL